MTRTVKPKAIALPVIGDECSVWFQRKVRLGVVIMASMGSITDPTTARATVRFRLGNGDTITRTLPWKPAPAILEAHTPAFAYPLASGRDTVRA